MNQNITSKIRSCLAYIDGVNDGEEFFIDDDLTIHVPDNNLKISSLILRKINLSNMFDQKLVRITKKGDSIILGFDSIADIEPIYSTFIGPDSDVEIEIKKDPNIKKFYIYKNGKRSIKTFTVLAKAKRYIAALDKQLDEQESIALNSAE